MKTTQSKIIRKGVIAAVLVGAGFELSACGDGYSRTSVGVSSGSSYDFATPQDRDADGIPNRVDNDRDGDGVPNRYDWAPNNPYRR